VTSAWSSGADFALSGSIRSSGADGKANVGFVIGGDEFAHTETDWGTPYHAYNPITNTWGVGEIQKMYAGPGAAITA
jgi:hypothetical protein